MNYGGYILLHLRELASLFARSCEDNQNLLHFLELLEDRGQWPQARKIFEAGRTKSKAARQANDIPKLEQCLFEEIIGKTLYNLTRGRAPFDPDSQYWVVPHALRLAKALEIEQSKVIDLISTDVWDTSQYVQGD